MIEIIANRYVHAVRKSMRVHADWTSIIVVKEQRRYAPAEVSAASVSAATENGPDTVLVASVLDCTDRIGVERIPLFTTERVAVEVREGTRLLSVGA
jgi:hypothetical protein